MSGRHSGGSTSEKKRGLLNVEARTKVVVSGEEHSFDAFYKAVAQSSSCNLLLAGFISCHDLSQAAAKAVLQ